MIRVSASPTATASKHFEQSQRESGESNLRWFSRRIGMLKEKEDGVELGYVALIGGKAESHFRLRVAQAHVRHDFSPSHWSHCALLTASASLARGEAKGECWEISLEPSGGFRFPPRDNALQVGSLDEYDSTNAFPNVALIQLPTPMEDLANAIKLYKRQRIMLDAVSLLHTWLGYAWGVGSTNNPLYDGDGIPSAALIETLTGACGFDITPGVDAGTSCPEIIWQAAKYWHEWYESADMQPLAGYWHTSHHLG